MTDLIKEPPYSELYDDIYFSTDDGLAESKSVFLDGIDAPDVWAQKQTFVICELGFGTGLNFLNTLKMWDEIALKEQKLIYIATEKHPLSSSKIEQAIHWSIVKPYLDEMLSSYPDSVELLNGRVSLELMIGDSAELLVQQKTKVDAWYMDGFAPKKNPDMWSDEIFKQMNRLSNSGARIATFTAAGFVRRGLQSAGFDMKKRVGYGKKREMLAGVVKGSSRL